MAMAIPRCIVAQQPDVIDETVSDQSASFLIEFSVSDDVLDYLWGGDCPLQLGQRAEKLTIGRSFLLGNQFLAFPLLSMSLGLLGIPTRFHQRLFQDIQFYADLLVNDIFDDICNASRRVIPVVVGIFLYHEDDEVQAVEEDGEEEVEDEDENSDIMDEILNSSFNDAIDHQLGVQPATEASIEAMKRLRFEGGGTYFANNTECMICLEEFEMGAEVNQMPCLHSFHRDCIVEWLQRSRVCPLCRYEMPHSMSS